MAHKSFITDDNRLLISVKFLFEIYRQLKSNAVFERKSDSYEMISSYLRNFYEKKLNDLNRDLYDECEEIGIGLSSSSIERAIKGAKGTTKGEVKYQLLDFLSLVCNMPPLIDAVHIPKYLDADELTLYSVEIPEYAQEKVAQYIEVIAIENPEAEANIERNSESYSKPNIPIANTSDSLHQKPFKIKLKVIYGATIIILIILIALIVRKKQNTPVGIHECKVRSNRIALLITNFSAEDDDDFSNHVYNILNDEMQNIDSVITARIGKYVNTSNSDYKDSIAFLFQQNCYNRGLLLFGKRSNDSKLFDCNIYLSNLPGLNENLRNNIIYIHNPDLINFSIDNQAKTVSDFILGLILYNSNNFNQSNKMFEDAINSNKNDENKKFKAYCHLFIGNNELRKNNYQAAIINYKLAIQNDSLNSYSHYNLAVALTNVDSNKANIEFDISFTLNNKLNTIDNKSNAVNNTLGALYPDKSVSNDEVKYRLISKIKYSHEYFKHADNTNPVSGDGASAVYFHYDPRLGALLKGRKFSNYFYGILINNDTVINCIYDTVIPYKVHEKLFFIVDSSEKYGAIDYKGKIFVPVTYPSESSVKMAIYSRK